MLTAEVLLIACSIMIGCVAALETRKNDSYSFQKILRNDWAWLGQNP